MVIGTRTPSFRERAVDAANLLGEKVVRWLDGYFGRHSLVGDRWFFDAADFPWAARIEAHTAEIVAELDEVLRHHADLPNFQDISTDQYSLTDDDRWKTFFFYGYGFRAGRNVERCPRTAQLVESIPGMKTAMFSILSPHKHIPPHGGPYKGVLRYHLALKIPGPPGACRIRVGEETRTWEEGRSLVFDDVFEHEAWNDSDGVRVVLFVDFVRPLPPPAKWLNELVIRAIGVSPFVLDAKARHNDWERRFERLRGNAA
jgi:beta-hydroxylase